MVTIYVEGGGDTPDLRTKCRQGFRQFFESAGFSGTMPKIISSGSREKAFDKFCIAVRQGKEAFLLVDSEGPVARSCQQGRPEEWTPWQHLKDKDTWERPELSEDTQCHLMVECMENWFLADRKALKDYFQPGFNDKALPSPQKPIEECRKKEVFKGLQKATKKTPKRKYDKGSHAFAILQNIDAQAVYKGSQWAKRLHTCLKKHIEKGNS